MGHIPVTVGELPGQLRPPTTVWLICWSNVGPCAFIFMHGDSLRRSTLQFTALPFLLRSFRSPHLYPCFLNPNLNYPSTGSQCSEMDLIIRISAGKVHLGTATSSTATRRHVSVTGGGPGPLRPNCFRQVKETGGRMCSCAPHVPGSRSAGVVSWGRRDTAAIFMVCSAV